MTLSQWLFAGAVFWAAPVFCDTPAFDWAQDPYDIFVLGEVHDNPQHHAVQAAAVHSIRPTAVVYEMLTAGEAAELVDVDRTESAMWNAVMAFHWDNIADYAEILAASPVIVGAAEPRSTVRAAFSDGAAAVFNGDADAYGLTDALLPEEQTRREIMQFAAHCEAMPRDLMGGMVEAQRLRDAAFAKSVLDALEEYGAPVVLITGNGHARADWGVPAYVARVAPEMTVFALGQGEGGTLPDGVFTAVRTDAVVPERDDPCAAFQ